VARGETLRQAAASALVPVRYAAAFEGNRPLLVFHSLAQAEPFLIAYARHLGIDGDGLVGTFRSDQAPLARRLQEAAPVDGHRGRVPSPTRARRSSALVAGLAVISLVVILIEMVPDAMPSEGRPRATVSPPAPLASSGVQSLPELPGGGTVLFPYHRVVAYYGSPISEQLGILGTAPPADIAAQIVERGTAFAGPGLRPVLPAFQLISTVTSRSPGNDGKYRFRIPEEEVGRYVRAAADAGALLVIDIQPGRSDFLTEAQAYERFLRQPHVGLALDPEWRMGPDQVPGDVVGSVDAAEVNAVADYLAELVRQEGLPQKLFVIHQFNTGMITRRDTLATPPELAVVIDVDGVGPRSIKLPKYERLTEDIDRFFVGIKLYTKTEPDMLSPHDVLGLDPRPDLVIYQ
jgi:hypothetical protein